MIWRRLQLRIEGATFGRLYFQLSNFKSDRSLRSVHNFREMDVIRWFAVIIGEFNN